MNFDLSKLTEGKRISPIKMIIYGENGVGKSHFADSAKNPIFADLEKNSGHLHNKRQPINNWYDLLAFTDYLTNTEHDRKTYIIDSLDTADSYCTEYVTDNYRDLSFGKGMGHRQEQMTILRKKLDLLVQRKGMNIILTGHQQLKPKSENNIRMKADRYEPTMNEKVFRILYDWSNCTFFMTKEDEIMQGGNKNNKLSPAKPRRYLDTDGSSLFSAKNIYKLPKRIYLPENQNGWNIVTGEIMKFFQVENKKEEIKSDMEEQGRELSSKILALYPIPNIDETNNQIAEGE